jgi:hypothetical protein
MAENAEYRYKYSLLPLKASPVGYLDPEPPPHTLFHHLCLSLSIRINMRVHLALGVTFICQVGLLDDKLAFLILLRLFIGKDLREVTIIAYIGPPDHLHAGLAEDVTDLVETCHHVLVALWTKENVHTKK